MKESEDVLAKQAPKEVHQLVEVGFDLCGTSEELDLPTNIGKPPEHLTYSVSIANFISSESCEMCTIRDWLNTNSYMLPLKF